MKKLRTFQVAPQDEDGEVQQIVALLKLHTPAKVISEAIEGGKLYSQRKDLQTQCESLAENLLKLNPYIKKSVLETAVGGWDQENNGKLSKGSSKPGLWVKMEAYTLKDLILKNIKKAHNILRYSRDNKREPGHNMGNVVKALLHPALSRDSSLDPSEKAESVKATGGWVDKHRRLLRKRSSEVEEVALVAVRKMSEHASSSSTSRSNILALYGVKDEEMQCPVPAPAVSNPKVQETEVEDVIDLTDDPSPGKEPPPATAISKAYFDTHRGKIVKAWDDGSVEEAKTEKGEGGFLVGYFADGSTYASQVPNVCFELKNTEKFFLMQRRRGVKRRRKQQK